MKYICQKIECKRIVERQKVYKSYPVDYKGASELYDVRSVSIWEFFKETVNVLKNYFIWKNSLHWIECKNAMHSESMKSNAVFWNTMHC